MKIGIVLAKTPSYSETFFISKIEGLIQKGFDVTLFVQEKAPEFNTCKVVVSKRPAKKGRVIKLIYAIPIICGLFLKKRETRLKLLQVRA